MYVLCMYIAHNNEVSGVNSNGMHVHTYGVVWCRIGCNVHIHNLTVLLELIFLAISLLTLPYQGQFGVYNS